MSRKKVTFAKCLQFARNYWRRTALPGIGAVVFMLSSVLVDTLIPVYSGQIVDAMTQGDNSVEVAAGIAFQAFMMFMFFGVVHHLLRFVSFVLWNKFAVRNLYNIVTEAMHKVQRFSTDWHANTFAGGTVRKITRGMWAFDQFEDTLFMGLMPALTIMVGMTVMLWIKLPAVGMVALTMAILYSAASIWVSVTMLRPRFMKSAEADTKMGAVLADAITSNPTVKAFGAEKREEQLFNTVAENWHKKSVHAWQVASAADVFRNVFRLAMMGGMIAVTIILWKNGQATPGDITLVMTSFFIIGGYLRDIGMHIAHLQRSMSEMEDIVTFWSRDEDVRDVDNATQLTIDRTQADDGLIVFDNVGFSYPSDQQMIYDGMSVEIKAGEKVALVGASGSGKSTFVKLVQRLYNLDEGCIRIAGQDIAKVTLESLRQSIALVPQDPILFHRTLAENIAYGKPDATPEEIAEAAKKAYAHDFINNLPLKYETLVGERGIKLSGGERQRVAIARAILADAPILILDEATSSLDSVSEHYIQKALEELMKGRTTITIAHRLSTIQRADRILVFDQGQIVEQGTHSELLSRASSRYKTLYEMQALDLTGDDTENEDTKQVAG